MDGWTVVGMEEREGGMETEGDTDQAEPQRCSGTDRAVPTCTLGYEAKLWP